MLTHTMSHECSFHPQALLPRFSFVIYYIAVGCLEARRVRVVTEIHFCSLWHTFLLGRGSFGPLGLWIFIKCNGRLPWSLGEIQRFHAV